MIHPQMATTLGFVMTDAQIPPAHAARHAEARGGAQLQPPLGGWRHVHQRHAAAAGQRRLRRAARPAGAADVEEAIARVHGERWRRPSRAMAKGARKFDHHTGVRARPSDDGRRAHRPRHRQFAAGEDGHRGVRSQLGPHPFAPPATRAWRSIRRKADIWMQGVLVCRGGLAAPFSEEELKTETGRARSARSGWPSAEKAKATARFWTCDLTEGYIRINASYRT